MIHTSIANIQPAKKDNKYITSEYINFLKYLILEELFRIETQHSRTFGQIVICLDNAKGGYWRKDFFKGYKSGRKEGREESDIDYNEIFYHIDIMKENLKNYSPYKVVDVQKAEADDIMLVLAREYHKTEKILIYSPDKDMIQAQRDNDTVFQYSALTKKWLVPENKHDNMDQWIMEHIVMGDDADAVPRVIDGTEFSENFLQFLKINDCDITEVKEFKESKIDKSFITSYNVYCTNKKGEPTELDIYKKERFGASNISKILSGEWELKQRKKILENKKAILKQKKESIKEINKEIKELEIIDDTEENRFNNWLNSHPLYKEHYDRNFVLVMEEGIPKDIKDKIKQEYITSCDKYDDKKFKEYLIMYNLEKLQLTMPNSYVRTELTLDDFTW